MDAPVVDRFPDKSKEQQSNSNDKGQRPALLVTLLGDFSLQLTNSPAFQLRSKKASMLVVYLLYTKDQPVARLHPAKCFWSRHAEEQALASLRQSLFSLKTALPNFDHYFYTDKQSIGLSTDDIVTDLDLLRGKCWFSGTELEQLRSLCRHLPLSNLELSDNTIIAWLCQVRSQIYQEVLDIVSAALFSPFLQEPINANAELEAIYQQLLQQKKYVDFEFSRRCGSQRTKTVNVDGPACADELENPPVKIMDAPSTASAGEIHRFLLRKPVALDNFEDYLTYLREKLSGFWLQGVLAQNCGKTLLDLSLKPCNQLLDQPYHSLYRLPQIEQKTVRSSDFLGVYLAAKGRVLLTGAPGSGKTCLMLRLMQQLLRGTQNPGQTAVPIIFNLSTWKTEQSLETWLINELDVHYDIPPVYGSALVRSDYLVIFLDAFDESAPQHHRLLADAINAFIREHPLTPIAVSSRTYECERLEQHFVLNYAFALCPVSSDTFEQYLTNAGNEYEHLREAKVSCQNLDFSTPLAIYIYTHASNRLKTNENTTLNHRQLVEYYLDASLSQIPGEEAEDLRRFLIKLAQLMNYQESSLLYLEELTHLSLRNTRLRKIAVVLPMSIIAGAAALILGISGYIKSGDTMHLLFPWPLGILGVVTLILTGEAEKQKLLPRLRLSFNALKLNLQARLLNTFYAILAISCCSAYLFGISNGIVLSVAVFAAFCAFLGLDFNVTNITYRNFSQLNEPVIQTFRNSIKGLMAGALLGLGVDCVLLGYWPFGAGITLFSVILFFILGGLGVMQHYLVRGLLALENRLPLKLSKRIRLAYRLRLLNKVGGGLMFNHRSLQDYLAGKIA